MAIYPETAALSSHVAELGTKKHSTTREDKNMTARPANSYHEKQMISVEKPTESKGAKPLEWLQERFLRSGLEDLSDQQFIELLLGLFHHRSRSRLARDCIALFQNLRGFLAASPEELQEIGVSYSCALAVKLLRKIPEAILREKIIDERASFASSQEIFNYLYYSMRDLKKEVFKAVYFNNRSEISNIIDLFEGAGDFVSVRPLEIVDSAIKHNAKGLIFVHNHPSGDPTPSTPDKQLTRDLVFVGMILQIKVLDHIIIGDNQYVSFADKGLIQKYEDSFLAMKIGHLSDTTLTGKCSNLSRKGRIQGLQILQKQLHFPEGKQ